MKDEFKSLISYSVAHAAVDCISAAVIFSIFFPKTLDLIVLALFVLLYNILAFGTQFILGDLADYLKKPKAFALVGIIFCVLALLIIGSSPLAAVILIGLGNALFHVGGGIVSLNIDHQKAWAPGIFVAPGTIGLLIGTVLGKTTNFSIVPFLLLAVVTAIIIYYAKTPDLNYEQKRVKNVSLVTAVILLLLFSVLVRSFVGFILNFAWKSDFFLLLIFIAAVFLGKAMGGILGDRLGWIKVGFTSLMASAILLYVGPENAIFGIAGIFFFNMTMPITLTALSNSLPSRPGFAFGLTTLALLFGYLLAMPSVAAPFFKNEIVLLLTIASAIALFLALKLLFSKPLGKSFKQENDK